MATAVRAGLQSSSRPPMNTAFKFRSRSRTIKSARQPASMRAAICQAENRGRAEGRHLAVFREYAVERPAFAEQPLGGEMQTVEHRDHAAGERPVGKPRRAICGMRFLDQPPNSGIGAPSVLASATRSVVMTGLRFGGVEQRRMQVHAVGNHGGARSRQRERRADRAGCAMVQRRHRVEEMREHPRAGVDRRPASARRSRRYGRSRPRCR